MTITLQICKTLKIVRLKLNKIVIWKLRAPWRALF